MNFVQRIIKFLIFLQLILTIHAGYIFTLKSVKCFNVDPTYVTVQRCQVKAEKGRRGVLYGHATLSKPVTRQMGVTARLQFFWRSSSGRYDPYIVDLSIEACEAHKFLNSSNPAVKMIVKIARAFVDPELIQRVANGCPISGAINVSGVELNDRIAKVLPPVVPVGIFKITIHGWSKTTNRTIADIEFVLESKAVLLTDAFHRG